MSNSALRGGGLVNSAAFKMLVGGAAGALVILPLARWLKTQPTFELADVGAIVVAALLMLAGAMTILPTLDGRALARALEPDAGEGASLSPRELWTYRLQGLVMILAGILLAAPPMLADQPQLAQTAYLGLVAVFVVQTVLNLLVWRGADTFHRRLTIESGALAFWSLQGALFLWAAAERMGLAPALSAWGGLVILMCVYLLAGSWTALRRMGA